MHFKHFKSITNEDMMKFLESDVDAMSDYQSPITVLIHDVTNSIVEDTENKIVAEVKEQLGIDINKEELIKTLKYDRSQYVYGFNKGYDVGYEQAKKDILGKILEIIND